MGGAWEFVAGILVGLFVGASVGALAMALCAAAARLSIEAETEGWDLEGPAGLD